MRNGRTSGSRVLMAIWLIPALAAALGAERAAAQAVYEPSVSAFANPERGWMWTNQPFCTGTTPIGFVDFGALRSAGVTLIDQVYVLDDFRDAALSQAFLDQFTAECDRVRAEGMKMVPRFSYNWIASCSGTADAPSDRVLSHLGQLAPLLRANEDVLAMLQVSFIGRYGEMHTSSQGHVDPGTVLLAPSGNEICDAVLAALPAARSWAMRYPQARSQRHPVPLDASAGYTGTDDARTGLANHGFASDPTDYGTWSPDPAVRAVERDYAEAVTRWTPMLGEPGGALFDGQDATPEQALADTERFHYSVMVMNQGDALSTGVYDAWDAAGVLGEMDRRLGYRYRMISGDLIADPTGRRVEVALRIANDGFAAPINPRGAALVLRSADGQTEVTLPTNIHDLRRGFPGPGETTTVLLRADLPDGLVAGAYDVLLSLPDPAASLAGRPEYAIRVANTGVWEPGTGLNRLGLRAEVRPRRVETKPPAELVYFEASVRNRTPYIVANAERLRELPFDGLMVNIPASWRAMSGERWTFEDSFGPWIEPLGPVFANPAYGLTSNYLMVFVDRPADFLGDWSATVENFADLARLAREGGFVGIAFDNEQYAGRLWNWPEDAADPSLGRAAYEGAAWERGREIGAAMREQFPRIRLMFLHGPYIADDRVPDFIRRSQFGVGEFELFGPFYAGIVEGLGPQAQVIDGGEVYALRDAGAFRDHGLWRRWGLSSSAHDPWFLLEADRRRHRKAVEIAFGVYTGSFPAGVMMSPDIMRTTLENALRSSDTLTWLYSEEGLSAWEPEQFGPAWLDAVRGAKAAAIDPMPTLRFGTDDLHTVHRMPFDADLNGVVDLQDREAVEGETRMFERPL